MTSDYNRITKEQGEVAAIKQKASKEIKFVIDIPANRYDLLGLEGICNALNVFLGNKETVFYKKCKPQYTMRVTENVKLTRPYIVCAVMRDFKITESVYDRFLEIQEKLHNNICRKRNLVAIGIHNLDSVTPDFLYDARKISKINFVALNEEKKYSVKKLFGMYNKRNLTDCHVKDFLPLIQNQSLCPVLIDKEGMRDLIFRLLNLKIRLSLVFTSYN